MQTEIIKIIEGGINGDKEKVYNYAKLLANNIQKEGNEKFSKRIIDLLNNKKGKLTSMDSLMAKPVDTESRAEMVEVSNPQLSAKNIILDKYIEVEIDNFIKYYQNRDKIILSGLDLNNSLLLYGPPGCGKTTIAQYVSNITGLPLVTARLDALVSSLLGSTAKNIRKLFEYASKTDCILFLDEFDVIAKLRDDKNELGELKRVVNSLIQNIDNFSSNSILIAATNHHELLDPAIWRRFSRILEINKPNENEIEELLAIFLDDNNYEKIIKNQKQLQQLKKLFLGFSHSDIKTIIQNCLKQSIIQNKVETTYVDIIQEIYLYSHHSIKNEIDFIKFLSSHNITQKEINENFGFPMRKIQSVTKL